MKKRKKILYYIGSIAFVGLLSIILYWKQISAMPDTKAVGQDTASLPADSFRIMITEYLSHCSTKNYYEQNTQIYQHLNEFIYSEENTLTNYGAELYTCTWPRNNSSADESKYDVIHFVIKNDKIYLAYPDINYNTVEYKEIDFDHDGENEMIFCKGEMQVHSTILVMEKGDEPIYRVNADFVPLLDTDITYDNKILKYQTLASGKKRIYYDEIDRQPEADRIRELFKISGIDIKYWESYTQVENPLLTSYDVTCYTYNLYGTTLKKQILVKNDIAYTTAEAEQSLPFDENYYECDLDHDNSPELILYEGNSNGDSLDRIYVIDKEDNQVYFNTFKDASVVESTKNTLKITAMASMKTTTDDGSITSTEAEVQGVLKYKVYNKEKRIYIDAGEATDSIMEYPDMK